MSDTGPVLGSRTGHTFDAWWAKYGQHYERAVVENDGEPWTRDPDERRALFARRHHRPAPPAGLHTELQEIRR